ncbi:hypothetical protein PCASD_02465 [Puccinia coronata f. sp. avenae]|uniref:Peptidase A2 domain-containing protein n=1 Tax=Puccinia coronata f. sp. avenae TaxID=200324 RepID=A0A2N5VMH0_9BASI|nr:hypothetical protein PCASD_02465 [Puccinia coronata f. sp. avenae]
MSIWYQLLAFVPFSGKLTLSVRAETTTTSTLETPTTPIKDGWVDLQCFRASNGPLYTGLARAIKPFLNWIQGVQIFFTTKDVTHNLDKLRIVGSLIRETNTLAFYTGRATKLETYSWEQFKRDLFDFALPPLWQSSLRKWVFTIRMADKELFLTYSTRVRTLQRMINLDEQTLMDSQLAEFVTIGLPFDLRAMVNNFELLLKQPFNYMYFEQRALSDRSTCRRVGQACPISSWDRLHRTSRDRSDKSVRPVGSRFGWTVSVRPPVEHGCWSTARAAVFDRLMPAVQGAITSATPSAPSAKLTKEETIWQIHSFLDSEGRCHWCKKTCGSVHGTCLAPIDQSRIQIPTTFTAPTKPTNYTPPKAWGPNQSAAGKPTQPPAGRATEIDKELRLAREDKYVYTPQAPQPQIVIELQHGEKRLRGLVDTGLELNLISNTAAKEASLIVSPLRQPTTVRLELDNKAPSNIRLTHQAQGSFTDPHLTKRFHLLTLKVGPIIGDHDMILGTPFLSQFHLSVSISENQLRCIHLDYTILDYRQIHAMKSPPSSSCAIVPSEPNTTYPCEESEKQVLRKFAELFPQDIPAVSDSDDFVDGTFPEKLQLEQLTVRHRIILTDLNTIINKKHYPYPQKHLHR